MQPAIPSPTGSWSAQVCEQATLANLDPAAIAEARRQFAEKNKTRPDRLTELAYWDDTTFLNKAKLPMRGAVTHAALLLLGREESSALLAPAVARVSWILKNKRNEELYFEHFGRQNYRDMIAQEIVDDLEAALEQFRLIAGDLAADAPQATATP